MKSFISVIDGLGRLIIPEMIVNKLDTGQEVQLKISENQIIADLTFSRRCLICKNNQDLIGKKGIFICKTCLRLAIDNKLINISSMAEIDHADVQLLDDAGRIYIPSVFREKLCIEFNTGVILVFDEENMRLFIRPEISGCFICGSKDRVYNFKKINLCSKCYKEFLMETSCNNFGHR